MALENWIDKQDGIDDILAEDINSIANAVIETQEEINKIVIDQTYSPESENAQSGKAVAEAVAKSGGGTTDYEQLENLPEINGVELLGNKSLTDLGIDIPAKTSELENDSGFIDDTAFENYYTKTEVDEKMVVDQTYDKNSQNAQSGKAVAEAVDLKNTESKWQFHSEITLEEEVIDFVVDLGKYVKGVTLRGVVPMATTTGGHNYGGWLVLYNENIGKELSLNWFGQFISTKMMAAPSVSIECITGTLFEICEDIYANTQTSFDIYNRYNGVTRHGYIDCGKLTNFNKIKIREYGDTPFPIGTVFRIYTKE